LACRSPPCGVENVRVDNQEILGDLHSLFGDTNTVHVSLNDNGETVLETIIKGDTVSEVLQYVQFNGGDLFSRLQTAVERNMHDGWLDQQEGGRLLRFYEDGLHGYTYLEEPPER